MSHGMPTSSHVQLAGHQTPLVDVPAGKELQLAGHHGPGSINYMVLSNLAFLMGWSIFVICLMDLRVILGGQPIGLIRLLIILVLFPKDGRLPRHI